MCLNSFPSDTTYWVREGSSSMVPVVRSGILGQNIGAVYGPESFSHLGLYFGSDAKSLEYLKAEGVIGHYHEHPSGRERLPSHFSQEDINVTSQFKRNLGLRNFLIGVGADKGYKHFSII